MNSSVRNQYHSAFQLVSVTCLVASSYVATSWPNPASILTSVLLACLVFSQSDRNLLPKFLACIAVSACIFITTDLWFIREDRALDPNVLVSKTQEFLDQSVDFYMGSLDALQTQSIPYLEGESSIFFRILDDFLSNAKKSARRNRMPAPSCARYVDSEGNLIAWTGDGFELSTDWKTLARSSDNGIETVQIPGGIDIIFWSRLSNGGGLLLTMPFSRNSIAAVSTADADHFATILAHRFGPKRWARIVAK